MLISTSFLSSKNIPKDLVELNETTTDYIHVDLMDGKFVKNKTMPFSEMSKIYYIYQLYKNETLNSKYVGVNHYRRYFIFKDNTWSIFICSPS